MASLTGIIMSGIQLSQVAAALTQFFGVNAYTGTGATKSITNGVNLSTNDGLMWVKSRSATTGNILTDTVRGISSILESDSTTSATGAGVLSAATTISTGTTPVEVCISTDGTSVYSVNSGSSTISIFTRNTAGVLSGSTTIGTNANPQAICISPDGTNVYVTTSSGSVGYINCYTRNTSTGALTAAAIISLGATTSVTFALCISPDGTTIYVGDYYTGPVYIYIFTRNTSTGVLTQYTTISLPASCNPQGICISPDGTSAYITYQNSNLLGIFTRNISTGNLTANGTIATGTSPQSVTISPDGTSVYVTNNTSTGTISIFTRNTLTGTLSGTTTVAGTARPWGIIVSPDGTNVYFTNNAGASGVYSYIRNTSTGALTSSAYISSGGNSAQGICISADGASVYVANAYSASLAIFSRSIAAISSTTTTGFVLGASTNVNANTVTYASWTFANDPKAFNIVTYTGNGAATQTISHGLTVVPTLSIIKCVTATSDWPVTMSSNNLFLNTNAATTGAAVVTLPTSTTFTVNNAYNTSGAIYVAYLFATLPSTSIVGSYIGNGTASQIINCGFSSTARFVLIKRTDAAGDWFVWDTARGINATGNSPHLSLNTTVAEVTTDASILPNSSGFAVSQVAATNVNITAGTYIYIAFA